MAQKTNLKNKKFCVLGGGSWGTAVAVLLANNGYDIIIWEFRKDLADKLASDKENKTFLPGIKLSDSISVTNSISEAVEFGDYICFVIPSHVFRSVAKSVAQCNTSGKKFISATKGIEHDSLMRMSEILLEEIPDSSKTNVAVLSGPGFAVEVVRDIPTAVSIASENLDYAKEVQELFMCSTFRPYINNDIIGVELGGSFKNVMAIATGILDGIGYGDNAKAALLTRGLVEMSRLGVKLGANPQTFNGLSGVGDLILTCTGAHSRNLHVGKELGKGRKLNDILQEMVMVAEGVYSAESVKQISEKFKVETPIMEQVYKILFEDKEAKKAIIDLMTREAKQEK
ncbi:NAD(P)H-dependent glycerol-3-phosphate dehydrogenase [candidate division KSB1 bacterium]